MKLKIQYTGAATDVLTGAIMVPRRMANWLHWKPGDVVEVTAVTLNGCDCRIRNQHAAIRRALEDRRRTPQARKQQRAALKLSQAFRGPASSAAQALLYSMQNAERASRLAAARSDGDSTARTRNRTRTRSQKRSR